MLFYQSSGNAVIKIIIESGTLTDNEIIKCCDLYELAADFGNIHRLRGSAAPR
jgi:deoxyribose-phosphate aldolase